MADVTIDLAGEEVVLLPEQTLFIADTLGQGRQLPRGWHCAAIADDAVLALRWHFRYTTC